MKRCTATEIGNAGFNPLYGWARLADHYTKPKQLSFRPKLQSRDLRVSYLSSHTEIQVRHTAIRNLQNRGACPEQTRHRALGHTGSRCVCVCVTACQCAVRGGYKLTAPPSRLAGTVLNGTPT